jgi:hypothetical protein
MQKEVRSGERRNPVHDGPFVDTSDLYRLPWSKHDNPIGWLETTDACDLACKGCYRQKLEGHKSFDLIKEEIVQFKRYRNCDCIVMAGGEPTLHPEFLETVAFINEQGMKPHLATGGQKLLDMDFLREMRKAGLEGMGIHLDSKQGRPGWTGKSEIELNALREEIADRINEVGKLNCSFGITVFRDNLEDVPALARWTLENRHRVGGFSFICYRGARIVPGFEWLVNGRPVEVKRSGIGYATKAEQEALTITSYEVMRKIQEGVPEWEPCTFLGGTQSHRSVKWLIGVTLTTKGKVLGSMGRKTMEFAQVMHHLLYKRYLVYSRESRYFPRAILALGLFDRGIRRMWKHYLLNPLRIFRRVGGISFGVVQAPDVLPDGSADMCDACPDMTIWNGEFVYSCRMDEYRRYGGLLSPIDKRHERHEEAAPTALRSDS